MKRTIQFAIYLFYKYYLGSKYTKDIAYFNSIVALTALLTFNIICLLLLFGFNAFDIIPESAKKDNYFIREFGPGLLVLPMLLLLFFVFKEQKIKTLNYSYKEIKKGKLYLILYVILTFIFFVFVVFAHYHGFI